ncbi:MAG: U32 family peptidase [Clostridia bacterium]|nr:U32 family peptidase [Clostridia bacterium]
MNNIEILAPVGSAEALKAAVLSGADAVYFGMGNFNARRNAQNFSTDAEIKDAIEYCHSRGVRVHITLNTLIKDAELKDAIECVRKICTFGADAIIVQDLGLAKVIKSVCPDIEMHASTQMSVGTLQGLYILKELGFSRAVLPRELSFEEIKYLCKHSPIDLEMFIHGALCMCVSGQCLMSAVLGSRSGNRGLCAQPCRLPFKVQKGTGHDLSLKDLSLIEHIPELAEMGVCSFKIEGRMKRPEYVSAVVTACKKSMQGKYDCFTEKDLSDLFSRSGFTDGYYKNRIGREMFGFREKENVQSATKELLSRYASVYDKEQGRFNIKFTFQGKIGEKANLTANCNGLSVETESEMLCEAPINRPISEDRIKDALSKCGGTQFTAESVKILGDVDYSLPVSALNSMRRTVLDALENKLLGKKERILYPAPIPTNIESENYREFYCRFDNVEQIPDNIYADMIFVPLGTDDNVVNTNNYGVELPHGMFGNQEKVEGLLTKSSAQYCLCHTLDAVAIAKKCNKKVIASPSMNIFNSLSMDVAKSLGIDKVIVSNECTLDKFEDISSSVPIGLTVYGRIPLMLTRNCPIRNGKTCAECKRESEITDRMGIKFPVKCYMGYSEILNSRPLYMADRMGEIPACDIMFFNFTTESRQDVESIVSAYENEEKSIGEFTRGLLYRGVE